MSAIEEMVIGPKSEADKTMIGGGRDSRFTSVGGETIVLGDSVISKEDLEKVLAVARQPPTPLRKFGDPTPLGLSAFALTTFVLSLVNVQARGVNIPSVVISLALFYGGLAQFCAGMWAFACGDTFGGVAFGSFGPFWMSWAALNSEMFGIGAAYKDDPDMFASAVGFYLFGWFVFTFMMVLCTLRTTWLIFIMYSLLDVTLLLLGSGNLSGEAGLITAGGYTGLITAFLAWYNAYGFIRSPQNTPLSHFDITGPC